MDEIYIILRYANIQRLRVKLTSSNYPKAILGAEDALPSWTRSESLD